MSIYGRDEILPEWEPAPWPMASNAADRQEQGFHERALKQIRWSPISWADFPTDGIFGHSKDWFASRDVEFTASVDGEDLLLIRNVWFGWPDPPEWGLASRPTLDREAEWQRWGHFPELPAAWTVPVTR